MPQPWMKPKPQEATAPAFRLRKARRGDGEALAALLAELGYPQAADVQTVNWVVSHPEIEIFVAGDGHDRPVGMVSFSHRPQLRLKGRIVTIDELVVARAWRRKGVGSALLRCVLDRARTLSAKRIELAAPLGIDEGLTAFFRAAGLKESPGRILIPG